MAWYKDAKSSVTKDNAFNRMAAAGMSRLLQHMVSGPFAIISADRYGMTPSEKATARKGLKQTLFDMGLGFIDTQGAWKEEGTEDYSEEASFFVPRIEPGQAKLLGKMFGQEAVIIGDRGKYQIADLDSPKESSDVFELANTLAIPDLEATPDMYTQIGRRKFELRTQPEDIGNIPPEEANRRRMKYERLVRPIEERLPSVFEDVRAARGYAGNPPPMMAKYAVTSITAPMVGVASMSYFIPFAAKMVEVLPDLDPPPDWGAPFKRMAQSQPLTLEPSTEFPSENYEKALENLSDFRGDVASLFSRYKPGSNLKGFDSLYVGPSGDFFMLKPHTHNKVARDTIFAVNPGTPREKPGSEGSLTGGYSHSDLTMLSGIQRVQFYSDGMGITVDMSRPPNKKQLRAIKEAYEMTPMNRFFAEITMGGYPVMTFDNFHKFARFVNTRDPEEVAEFEI